jgi:hypothetical protein
MFARIPGFSRRSRPPVTPASPALIMEAGFEYNASSKETLAVEEIAR